MTLFILFVVVVFQASIFFWDKDPRRRNATFLIVCLFVTFAYFFLDQI